MKRIFTTLCACLVLILSVNAQDEQKKINEIKKNLDFIYATGTSTKDAEDARANARELLSLEIEQWLKDNVEGDFAGYIAKSQSNISEIETRRGNLIRAFVYVNKADILPYYKSESLMVVNTQNDDSQPVPVDTLLIVQQKTSQPQQAVQQNNVPEHEIAEVTQQAALNPIFVPSASEREMLKVKDLSGINKYISDGSKTGNVTAYGKYDANTKLFSKSYLFVFDKEGQVLAVLRKAGEIIINISTGNTDAVSNYGRCGVVWFQQKEN